MKKLITILIASLILFSGCVSATKYQEAENELVSLKSAYFEEQEKNRVLHDMLSTKEGELEETKIELAQLKTRVTLFLYLGCCLEKNEVNSTNAHVIYDLTRASGDSRWTRILDYINKEYFFGFYGGYVRYDDLVFLYQYAYDSMIEAAENQTGKSDYCSLMIRKRHYS